MALKEEADMSRERCEEVMRRYLTEVLMERKLEVIKEIAAEDMWDHSQPERGREGLEKHAGGFLAGIPDVKIVINHIVASEDTVVGIWTWHGTPVGEFLGIPAGREVECRVASIFKIRDGLLADYSLIVAATTTSEPIHKGGIANLVP
jgi:predicted ester cyclase